MHESKVFTIQQHFLMIEVWVVVRSSLDTPISKHVFCASLKPASIRAANAQTSTTKSITRSARPLCQPHDPHRKAQSGRLDLSHQTPVAETLFYDLEGERPSCRNLHGRSLLFQDLNHSRV